MQSKIKVNIRREGREDYPGIEAVVREAFAAAEHTDGDEQNLISRIRETEDYIPELSLVAVEDGNIVGHIMFSRILIGN